MDGIDSISDLTDTQIPSDDEIRQKRAERIKDSAAVLLILLSMLLPLPGLLRAAGPPMEEGFMLAFPDQILHGRFPHKDFLHLYGPGSLYVLAAVFAVFGVRILTERLLGLAQHAGVSFGLFGLLRPFGRRVATAAALVAVFVVISPGGLTALAWNGALALGVVALALGTAAGRRPVNGTQTLLLALSGVAAGAALLYRPDMVIAVALGLAALLWDLPRRRRTPLLVAFAVTVCLYVPHLLVSGIGDSINGMFLDPVFHLRGGRTLPVPPSWGSIDGFLERASALDSDSWPLPMLAIPHQIYIWFWLVPCSAVINVVAALRMRKLDRASAKTRVLWPASLFALGLLPQALQRPDSTHLAWVSGITFALLIPSLSFLIGRIRPGLGPTRAFAGSLLFMAVLFTAVIPFFPLRNYVDLVRVGFSDRNNGFEISNGGRVFYFGSENVARQAQQIVDELEAASSPGQRLIVGPSDLSRTTYSDSFFYYLFPDLTPGTRYLELDPGLANSRDSGLAQELKKNDWLILFSSVDGWSEPNSSTRHGSEVPNRIVDSEYCEVSRTEVFRLMKRCS